MVDLIVFAKVRNRWANKDDVPAAEERKGQVVAALKCPQSKTAVRETEAILDGATVATVSSASRTPTQLIMCRFGPRGAVDARQLTARVG